MLDELKQTVMEAILLLNRYSLAYMLRGSVSGFDRRGGLVVINPDGLSFEEMTTDDLVVIDLDGSRVDGKRKPSPDAATHAALYRVFANVRGVVHARSDYAYSWALAGRDIPCYGATHGEYFYGDIPCLRGLTRAELAGDLARSVGRLITTEYARLGLNPDTLPGCLCQSLGSYAWGKDPQEAVRNAAALESSARSAYRCEMIEPEVLPATLELRNKLYKQMHGNR